MKLRHCFNQIYLTDTFEAGNKSPSLKHVRHNEKFQRLLFSLTKVSSVSYMRCATSLILTLALRLLYANPYTSKVSLTQVTKNNFFNHAC